jgi:hypothetical protein
VKVMHSLGAILAALIVLMSAPGAVAASFEVDYANDLGELFITQQYCEAPVVDSGIGCFVPNDDDIYVKDNSREGASVGVHWITQNGREGLCIDSQGAPYWSKCPKIFTGTKIKWEVGTCDRSHHPCTRPGYADGWRDWGGWSEWITA